MLLQSQFAAWLDAQWQEVTAEASCLALSDARGRNFAEPHHHRLGVSSVAPRRVKRGEVAEKFELVQAQRLVELFDRRNRRFADTDDANLFGLDQRDATTRLHDVRQCSGRHPSGRTASGDDDAGQFAIFVTHNFPERVTCCFA